MRRLLLLLATAVLVVAAPRPAAAVFHFAVIDEILTSHDGDAAIQFVEIRMLIGAQTQVEDSVLGFFGPTGTYAGDVLVVPNNIANGGQDVRWLMGTTAFATASGISVDFEFPAGIIGDSGMICWGAPGSTTPDPLSWDHTDPDNYTDCVAYGGYTGTTSHHVGTPSPLDPVGHSLVRVGESDNNAADFACGDPATPTNNAGPPESLAATVPCPAAPVTKAQAKCIDKLHGAANGVAKATSGVVKSCTGGFAKGKNTSTVDCLGPALMAKLPKPSAKTTAAEAKFCAGPNAPSFGTAGADAWNDAFNEASLQAVGDFFQVEMGSLDDVLVTKAANAAGAKCQAAAITQIARTVDGLLKASQRAHKSVYAPKTGAAPDSAAAAATALDDAFANDAKITKLLFSVGSAVGKACPASFATLVGDRCSASPNPDSLGGCLFDVAACAVCRNLEEATALELDCAAFSSEVCEDPI
jgi:hypothetical protein